MGALAVVVATAVAGTVRAEDVEKKFRLGVTVGTFLPQDKSHSTSANIRTLLNPDGTLFDYIYDPRNDSAAIGDYGVRGQYAATVSASYFFTKSVFLEGSVGYRRGDVGNIEVQAQFSGTPSSSTEAFQFRIFDLSAGTLQQVPVEVTAGMRFRPKTGFNPYVVLGVGYSFNQFTPSDDLNGLSTNMDRSIGGFAPLEGTLFGGELLGTPSSFVDLGGITVDVPNTPEWHAGGGFEVSFKRHWVVYLDARYVTYSGKLRMSINGGDELGISVPSDQVRTSNPNAFGPFGAISIPTGGLIDGGSLVPGVGAPPGTDCSVDPTNCVFTGPKDGLPDPGFYYVHAGNVRFDGLSVQAGVRFTF